jgi:hypothetical protein
MTPAPPSALSTYAPSGPGADPVQVECVRLMPGSHPGLPW